MPPRSIPIDVSVWRWVILAGAAAVCMALAVGVVSELAWLKALEFFMAGFCASQLLADMRMRRIAISFNAIVDICNDLIDLHRDKKS